MKKRMLIFGLLGPALGYLVLFALTLSVVGLDVKFRLIDLAAFYLLVLIPFSVCVFVDLHLQNQWWWERIAAASIAQFIVSYVVMLIVLPAVVFLVAGNLWFGLVGAIPAAICSWLANRITESENARP